MKASCGRRCWGSLAEMRRVYYAIVVLVILTAVLVALGQAVRRVYCGDSGERDGGEEQYFMRRPAAPNGIPHRPPD